MGARPLVIHVCAVQYTAELLLLPQLEALTDRGYDIRVICGLDGGGPSDRLSRFRPADVEFPRSLQPRAMGASVRELLRIVGTLEPDLLHLHSPAVAIPVRTVPRRFLPSATKVAYTVHGFPHLWRRGHPRDEVLERVERTLARRTDLLLFQSREDLDRAAERGYKSRLRYLGNGVEPEWFQLSPPRRTGPLKLLFAGRLVREKGLTELLDAMERVDGVELAVAGGEIDSERDGVGEVLRQRAAGERLRGRVKVLGPLPKAELQSRLAASDMVVLPSHREGVPRSLIEGLAGARPVIATDIRGCRELVTDGQEGLLVPPGDVTALADAIRKMAEAPASVFNAMSAAARARAGAHHEEQVFDRLVSSYTELGVAV